MNVSSLLTLGAQQITTALAGTALTPLTGLTGLAGLSLFARFAGTGGTSVDGYIQQSPDGGSTWFDIANVHFTAAGTAWLTLIQGAAAAPLAMTDAGLAANTALNSGVVPLFDQFRLKTVSVGTWVSGLLTITAMPRG